MSDLGLPLAEYCLSGQFKAPGSVKSQPIQQHTLEIRLGPSYLIAAAKNPGLTLFTYPVAERIVFDNLTAAEVNVNGSTISASKEVIISAGAFQSPQNPMLSGIGPADRLTEKNIPLLLDRPCVGQNMADSIFFGPSHIVNLEPYGPIFRMHPQSPSSSPTRPGHSRPTSRQHRVRAPSSTALCPSTSKPSSPSYPSDWPTEEYFAISGFCGNFSNSLLPRPHTNATILAGPGKSTSRGTFSPHLPSSTRTS